MVKILSALLAVLSLNAQGTENYEIKGQIQGLQEGEKVTISLVEPTGHHWVKRDSAIVRNGEFLLVGIVPEGPREYLMFFDHHPFLLDIIVNKGDRITIKSNQDLSDFHHNNINDYVTVNGSDYYTSWVHLAPAYWLYEKSIRNLKRAAQHLVDSIGFDGPKVDEYYQSIDLINQAFADEFFTTSPDQTHPESTIAFPMWAYTVYVNSNHASFVANAYAQLNPSMQNSYFGKMLNEYSKLCVGQPFPDFTLPTAEGKQLALKDVVSRSKVTLVHFWAAQSYMKKQLQDELRVFYKKYHDKGLNIVGFYSDKYPDEWKDLVQKEQYPWYNVSDSKGEEGMTAKVYREYLAPGQKIANTTNVLIDAQGKILAWDVYGTELQWYLWKFCGQ